MARISRCLDDAARCNQQEVASQRITQVLVLQRVMATRFFLWFLAVSRVVEKIIDQWFGGRQVRNDLACGNEGWVKPLLETAPRILTGKTCFVRKPSALLLGASPRQGADVRLKAARHLVLGGQDHSVTEPFQALDQIARRRPSGSKHPRDASPRSWYSRHEIHLRDQELPKLDPIFIIPGAASSAEATVGESPSVVYKLLFDFRFASPPPIPIVAGQGLTTSRAGKGLTKRTSLRNRSGSSEHFLVGNGPTRPRFKTWR